MTSKLDFSHSGIILSSKVYYVTANLDVSKILSSELWFDLNLHQVKPRKRKRCPKFRDVVGVCFGSTPAKTMTKTQELTRQRTPIKGDVKSPFTNMFIYIIKLRFE